MERVILFASMAFTFIMASCRRESSGWPNQLGNPDFIAMEYSSEIISIDGMEYLSYTNHKDFIHPAIEAKLKKSSFHQQKLNQKTQLPADNLFRIEEIPVLRRKEFYLKVMRDGCSEFYMEQNITDGQFRCLGVAFAPGCTKLRTERDPQTGRILKLEVFSGEYLVGRKFYAYSETDNLRSFCGNREILLHPEIIDSYFLSEDTEGYPVIHHVKELFIKNQFIFYNDDGR